MALCSQPRFLAVQIPAEAAEGDKVPLSLLLDIDHNMNLASQMLLANTVKLSAEIYSSDECPGWGWGVAPGPRGTGWVGSQEEARLPSQASAAALMLLTHKCPAWPCQGGAGLG